MLLLLLEYYIRWNILLSSSIELFGSFVVWANPQKFSVGEKERSEWNTNKNTKKKHTEYDKLMCSKRFSFSRKRISLIKLKTLNENPLCVRFQITFGFLFVVVITVVFIFSFFFFVCFWWNVAGWFSHLDCNSIQRI